MARKVHTPTRSPARSDPSRRLAPGKDLITQGAMKVDFVGPLRAAVAVVDHPGHLFRTGSALIFRLGRLQLPVPD